MTDTIHDALPYYDRDIEVPALKALVDAEIARELKRNPKPTTDPRIPPEYNLFEVRPSPMLNISADTNEHAQKNPFLQAELSRVTKPSNQPTESLDTTRYALPVPTEADASVEDWTKALQNAQAQQEHQISRFVPYTINLWRDTVLNTLHCVRQTNLSLLQTYGPNAWRMHNYLLEADTVLLEKQTEQQKERITELNRERKNNQVRQVPIHRDSCP